MHRSTQLFLYCSGGEHSVKCEMVANKEEQRGVVHFLVAQGAGTRDKVRMPWSAVRRNHPSAWYHPSPYCQSDEG